MLSFLLLIATPIADGDITTVKMAVGLDADVGGVKKGVLCVPAGNIEAGDIAFPDTRDIANRLGSDEAAGRVVAIEASVCTAYMGVGKPPKSRLKISVAWQIESASSTEICEATFDGAIQAKGRDLRQDPTVMLDAIEQSFRSWHAAGAGHSQSC